LNRKKSLAASFFHHFAHFPLSCKITGDSHPNSSCGKITFRVSSHPPIIGDGVTEHETGCREELSGPTRVLLAMLGLVLTALLLMAFFLQPDKRLYGTHQQLGLPPCSFYYAFGIPCPTCGMTTSWAFLMRGEILASLHANAGGTLLALSAILAAPWSLLTAIRGRHFARMPNGRSISWTFGGIAVLAVLQWGCRLITHWHR
jgi:hypothetical protein